MAQARASMRLRASQPPAVLRPTRGDQTLYPGNCVHNTHGRDNPIVSFALSPKVDDSHTNNGNTSGGFKMNSRPVEVQACVHHRSCIAADPLFQA